jgi:hypothetical protein
MPTTKRLGYICTCGAAIRFGGGGIETSDELEAWRDNKRQQHWTVMVTHPEAIGGCGAATFLQADDFVLIEVRVEQPEEDHP